MGFVHLHLHSEYSLTAGITRINELADTAVSMAMPAVAITERGNLFSAIKFFRAMQNSGIKPIIGAELNLYTEDQAEQKRIVLLCQHIEGYRNLTKLITRSYVEGQIRGIPTIQYAWLADLNEGLIALSCAEQGDLAHAMQRQKVDMIEQRLEYWMRHFADRFYIELQRTGREGQGHYVHHALSWAENFRVPVVATNDVYFLREEDYEAHEARVCINQAYMLDDGRRPRDYSEQQYFRSQEAMSALFSDIPSAIENTTQIAVRCNIEFVLDRHFLPRFPAAGDGGQGQLLAATARDGLKQRLATRKSVVADGAEAAYQERLESEIKVIIDTQFSGYFLIVADFIQWAKKNNIPVGPGRGSGAGSLVAYALGITELDPLSFDLLFERFLNPERVSLPDFDIDFCMDRRDEVIEYVADKYGRDHVSQIITYSSMAARAVIRDVGRVLGHPYGFVDKLAKLVPFEIGMTLARALKEEEQLKQQYDGEDDVKTLIDLSLKLEGMVRNAGKHAGGLVIAPQPLTEYMPLYCEQAAESMVTQFDMGDVESIGLVKFDFLGLRTLTIIDWALKSINRTHAEQGLAAIDLNELPYDDAPTFKLIQSAQTMAVFQLESDGMRNLIKRLQPDSFEDLIALVALFRPGPLQSGMVDQFIERKQGNAAVLYSHAGLEPILKNTYGVILYQEQVMQIAQTLAGYTLGKADLLRRAMGKKKPLEMQEQRAIFIQGAVKHNIKRSIAEAIFDQMEKFAGYGFNKSHSAAYALIAYQTAWLKSHYPAAFMAAVLSSDMDNTDKVVSLTEELKRLNITLLPPSINHSLYNFTVSDMATIRYGLGAIKGIGAVAIENIVQAREEQGPFLNLFDLCRRLDLRKVNRRALDALIKSRSLDEFGYHRSTLAANLARAISYAEQYTADKTSGQDDLFGLHGQSSDTRGPAVQHDLVMQDIAEWSDNELLLGEKETLGLYLDRHPIECYEDELNHNIISTKLHGLRASEHEIVAGYIMSIRTRGSMQGKIAEVKIDDRSAWAVVTVYPTEYQQYRPLLIKDQLIIVEGSIIEDSYIAAGYAIKARKLYTLDSFREQHRARLKLLVNGRCVDTEETIRVMQTMMTPFKGGYCPIIVDYRSGDIRAIIEFGAAWRLTLDDGLLNELRELFGSKNVMIDYP